MAGERVINVSPEAHSIVQLIIHHALGDAILRRPSSYKLDTKKGVTETAILYFATSLALELLAERGDSTLLDKLQNARPMFEALHVPLPRSGNVPEIVNAITGEVLNGTGKTAAK